MLEMNDRAKEKRARINSLHRLSDTIIVTTIVMRRRKNRNKKEHDCCVKKAANNTFQKSKQISWQINYAYFCCHRFETLKKRERWRRNCKKQHVVYIRNLDTVSLKFLFLFFVLIFFIIFYCLIKIILYMFVVVVVVTVVGWFGCVVYINCIFEPNGDI